MTSTPRPGLSVVIPTRDRPDLLEAALHAVTATIGPDDEVIVVESGSARPAAVWAVVRRNGVRLLVGDRPGVSRARNLGWRAASHDLVAFLDDDIRVAPGWADAMVAALCEHPEAAFVAGRIDLPSGQGTLGLTLKTGDRPAVYDRRSRGGLAHSANVGMHRAMLRQVGGFDECLGPGTRWPAGEDPDLFDRCLADGSVGYYEPRAGAWHEHWRRARQYVVLQHRYGVGAGARLAKLVRSDRQRASIVARDDVWQWGVRCVVGESVRLDWVRATGSLLRLLGMIRGFVTAVAVPVLDGHFAPRWASTS